MKGKGPNEGETSRMGGNGEQIAYNYQILIFFINFVYNAN